MRRRCPKFRDGRVLLRLWMIDRGVVNQLLSGNLDDHFALPRAAIHAVVRDLPNGRGGELPLRGDRLDLFDAVALGDNQHPLLRLRQQDLIRRHSRLAGGDLGEIDLHPDAAARGHLRRGRRESGRAHVLNGYDVPGADQLEARFEQQLLGEGIAYLDLGTALLACVRQLFRRERRAVDPVAARARADREENVAHALRRGLDEILLLQDADTHRVDERIAGVAGREVDFATNRRDTHTVAVVADAAYDAGEQIPVARLLEWAEPEAVE